MSFFRTLSTALSQSRLIRGRRTLRRLRPRFALAYEQLEPRRLLAYTAEIVKDINTNPAGSRISDFVPYDGMLYFASSGTMWSTDGTEAGTNRVVSGLRSTSVNPHPDSELTVSGDYLYFVGHNSLLGTELWRTDGTQAGTLRLTDFAPPGTGADIYDLTDVNGELFFVANDGVHGPELYKSDGTPAGTQLVEDVLPGSAGSNPIALTNYNGKLYFTATGPSVTGLWASDGTEAGTQLVTAQAWGDSLVVAHGSLYLVSGGTLYRSDGTADGTAVFHSGLWATTEQGRSYHNVTVIGDRLFYSTVAASAGRPAGIYFTDAGEPTLVTTDILRLNPSHIAAGGDKFYFRRDSTFLSVDELLVTDGQTTTFLGDVDFRLGQSVTFASTDHAFMNGSLFFAGATQNGVYQLWKTDGTAPGTVLLKAIRVAIQSFVGIYPPAASAMFGWNDRLYFMASDSGSNWELWTSDGTSDGTRLLKDLLPGTLGSQTFETKAGNTLVYFTANTANWSEPGQSSQVGLWRSDGTEAGTVLLAAPQFNGQPQVVLGDTLYFTVFGQLWKSDGTPEGTARVKSVGTMSNFFVAGTLVYFTVGDQIWRSDGTENGTFPLVSRLNDFNALQIVDLNGIAYFSNRTTTDGRELWRSDGTVASTRMVKNIHPGSFGSDPLFLTKLNGLLYFVAEDGVYGPELWKSDGTEAGTQLAFDIRPGRTGSDPSRLFAVDDALYIVVRNRELWKYDPITSTALLVKDFNGIPGNVRLQPYASIDRNLLFLTISNTLLSRTLWTSDGTPDGTNAIFEANHTLFELTSQKSPIDGYYFFSYDDGVRGYMLYRTDGTSAGTHAAEESETGLGIPAPINWKVQAIGSQIYLPTQRQGDGGFELHRLARVANTPSVSPGASRNGGQTTSGLVVTRNSADGNEVTHVKITNIAHGSLFLNDGLTPVVDGDFVAFDEAELGFKFTPAAGFSGTATFGVQASTSDDDEGLGGDVVTAKVFVIPVFTDANDTLYLIATTDYTAIELYNVDPFAAPAQPLLTWPLNMTETLPLNTLGGDDQIFVQLPAGMSGPSGGIHFDTGAGTNLLTVRGGNVHIDSTSSGGNLVTIVTAGAQLTTARLDQLRLALQGADTKVTLLPNGGVSVLDDLELSLGTTLDVTNNTLILHSTEDNKDGRFADLRAKIANAQNGVDPNLITNWNGTGITSSTARTTNVATGFDLVGLGLIRNSDLDITTGIPGSSYTSFGGEPVGPHDLLLKYTYIGDANLNGVVSFDDYIGMDNAFFELIPNLGWATGDVNVDNAINFDDYSKVDQAFFFQGAPLSVAQVVPAAVHAVRWAEFDEAHAFADLSLAQAFTPGFPLPSISISEEPLQGPNAPPDLIGSSAPIASSERDNESVPDLIIQASDTLSDARLAISRRNDTRDLWDTALLDTLS